MDEREGERNALSEDDGPILELPLQLREWGRILRSPIKKRGHVVMDVCYPSGNIGRSVVSKGKEGRAPVIYRAARKSQWGGLYPAYQFPSSTTYEQVE